MLRSVSKIFGTTMIIGMLVFSTSCKKEKIKGCNISTADNYNSSAEENDGSCSFTGRWVYWTNSVVGAESADVYYDGVFVGTIANAFSSAPSCGQSGALTIAKTWTGNTANKEFSVQVDLYDSAGDYSTSITFTANHKGKTCTSKAL